MKLHQRMTVCFFFPVIVLLILCFSSAIASDDIITWIGNSDGFAKDGIFKRTSDPSFMFEYPIGSTKEELDESPGQVMRMKTPENVNFNASVIELPEGLKLVDFASKYYAKDLESIGTYIKVKSNKEITLKCGTKAYRSDFEWVWEDSIWIYTIVVSALKNDKCIYLAVHPWEKPERVAHIAESLSCK